MSSTDAFQELKNMLVDQDRKIDELTSLVRELVDKNSNKASEEATALGKTVSTAVTVVSGDENTGELAGDLTKRGITGLDAAINVTGGGNKFYGILSRHNYN